MGFPCVSAGKDSACDAGDLVLIPGLGRSPEEGNDYSLQYSGLDNSMDCKNFDAGRDWGQEKKGTTEDEMAGWHH